jgi:hypothetical protein
LILSFLSFFFCIWGCLPLCPSMQKSEDVCDSILVIMNTYSPHCSFPSWTNWRAAYQRLWAAQGHPDHTSALGVNFHHSFPINLSVAPWAVYFPCFLKIIATFMSGLMVSVPIQLYKEYAFKSPFHFLLLCWYQDTLGVNMIFREQMKSKSMLDVLFQCAQLLLSYVNQVRREWWSCMWVK